MKRARWICALALVALAVTPCAAAAEPSDSDDGQGAVSEVRYVTDSSGVSALGVDVGLLRSDVAAVLDGVEGLQEGSKTDSEQVSALSEDVGKVAESVEGIDGKVEGLSDDLVVVKDGLRDVADAVNAEPQEETVTLQNFEDIMALIPEDAPESIATYMTPALWGLALGIFAWFISYMWAIVDRLFNF